jgi:polysaccharide export outer membrane protein
LGIGDGRRDRTAKFEQQEVTEFMMSAHANSVPWSRCSLANAARSLLWLLLVGALLHSNAQADDYKIGAGDLLRISVFDHAELAQDARVSDSGNITFPLLGQLQVAGLSTRDIETLLARRLAEGAYLRQPQVSVTVAEYQSKKVGVMGQVAKPGQYALTQQQKVLDVLAQAGGVLSETADEEATLVRVDGSRLQINLKLLFDGQPDLNATVQNGDMVYVPRAPQFYVYGEVQHPGAYKLTRNLTVSRAVSMGGGLTAHGTERRAVIKRRDEQGKEHKVSVSSSDLLQADDVLLIKESLF